MPDLKASDGLESSASPHGQIDHEEMLNSIVDRLPDGYVFRQEVICRALDHGRYSPLCGPIIVHAEARGADGADWCKQVRYRSKDGAWHEVVVSSRDLVGASNRLVLGLIDKGFDVFGRPKEVCDLLRKMRVDTFLGAVSRTGWVGTSFETYICPTGEVLSHTAPKALDKSKVLFSGTPRVQRRSAGRVKDWCDALRPVQSHEAVLVGLCAGIAPVLLPVTGHPSFLLHICGNEAAGRLCSQVAAAVWGPVGCLDLSWSEPEKTLVAAIGRARDSLVTLTGYMPRHAGKLAAIVEAMEDMDAAGGAGGRVVILSTGIESLAFGSDRPKMRAGFRNVFDIQAEQWDESAIVESVTAALLASGSFGPAVVEAAMKWGPRAALASWLNIRREDILDALGRPGGQADTETHHAANVFGALYGAGQLAAKRDLLSVPKAEQLVTFRKLFLAWVGRNNGLLSVADRSLLSAVADEMVRLMAAGELVSLEGTQGAVSAEAIGWQDPTWFYLSGQAILNIAVAQGVLPERVVDLLLTQGLLQPGGERGHKFRLPSRVPGRPRAYRISPEALRFASAVEDVARPVDPPDQA
jgi:hypothetical protein